MILPERQLACCKKWSRQRVEVNAALHVNWTNRERSVSSKAGKPAV